MNHLRLYLLWNLILSLACSCAFAAENGPGSPLDKRFNVGWTVSVPAAMLSVTGIDPDFPKLKLPNPEEQGPTDFWIKKSSLNADFGTGVGCNNRKYIQVGLLSYSRVESEKVYAWLKQMAEGNKPVTLTLFGDASYLGFSGGKAKVPECVLFLKTWRFKPQNDYQQILKRIGEGQAEWVALAPALYMGTDAGDSDDLEIALATALPKNAVAVLSALNASKANGASSLRIDHVCGVPFIEPTDAFVKAYLLKSTKAVKAVKDEKLLPVARQCLSYLR